MENKHLIDSPLDAVFNIVDDEYEAEADMDLDSEPSSASTVIPDTAFCIKGNPVVIAETATRVAEIAPKAPQTAEKIVRREVELPASGVAMPPPEKAAAKGTDGRRLVTYEAAPVSIEPSCIETC